MQQLKREDSGVLHILLADDDKDDRFFFDDALSEMGIPVHLTTVSDGEKLMGYLSKNINSLPDVLFLDLHMPRKNGSECLTAIKNNKKLRTLPVIIYSMLYNEDVIDIFYKNGAYYYICKTKFSDFKKNLHRLLQLMVENKFTRPPREKFVLVAEEEEIK